MTHTQARVTSTRHTGGRWSVGHGDTVRLMDLDLTPPLRLKVRVVAARERSADVNGAHVDFTRLDSANSRWRFVNGTTGEVVTVQEGAA